MPILSALPYAIYFPNLSAASVIFEGVGAITTSGASAFTASELPKILHIWRSLVQFIGGVATTSLAIVILASLNLTGIGIHKSILFTKEQDNILNRILWVSKDVFFIYLFIALLSAITLMLAGLVPYEALCLGLSGISTGGLSPIDQPLDTRMAPFGAFLFGLATLFGAMSFVVLHNNLRRRDRRSFISIFYQVENRALYVMIIILSVLGIYYIGFESVISLLIEALFFVSTAGFNYTLIGLEMIPPIILVTLTLIGGAALSTAGGVKIIRILLLFRQLQTDLYRLTHPSRVYPVKFQGQYICLLYTSDAADD